MDFKEKILFLIVMGSVITFYFYANHTLSSPNEVWVFTILLPLLLLIGYYMYRTVQEKGRTNSGGNLSFLNSYELNPVYLQITEDNKFIVFDDYVEPDSITEYEWEGPHEIKVIASDDPNVGNPATTIYIDKTYNVAGNNTVLIILNADGNIYEQLNLN